MHPFEPFGVKTSGTGPQSQKRLLAVPEPFAVLRVKVLQVTEVHQLAKCLEGTSHQNPQ
jgi:hypothetical protein